MKKEVSAGGVIVRRRKTAWEVLVLKDMNNVWTFPKGRLEKGESNRRAAVREIQEEVGLVDLVYRKTLGDVSYTYRRNGTIAKTVHYFLFEYAGTKKPQCQASEGIKEASWVTIAKAIEQIGYAQTNRLLLVKTQTILSAV